MLGQALLYQGLLVALYVRQGLSSMTRHGGLSMLVGLIGYAISGAEHASHGALLTFTFGHIIAAVILTRQSKRSGLSGSNHVLSRHPLSFYLAHLIGLSMIAAST